MARLGKGPAVLAVVVAAATLMAVPAHTQEPAGETQVLVQRLLFDVRDTLIRVRNRTAGDLHLREATLDLSTAFSKDASGKVNLYVVSFGGGIGSESTQTLTVKLRPPEPGDPLPVSGAADALAEAILQAYDAVRFAATDDPPLRLTELEAKIRFVVTSTVSADAGVSILPISVEMAGEVSQSDVHSITLAFCNGPCP
jgi:hypothetical protein